LLGFVWLFPVLPSHSCNGSPQVPQLPHVLSCLKVKPLLLGGRVEVALDRVPAISTMSLPDLSSPSDQHCVIWRCNHSDYLCISIIMLRSQGLAQ
jgi:hypothetical protein